MTVVRINAITVSAEKGGELAHRFAARAGAVDRADGFEGFELLQPSDGRDTWLVMTRWRDEAAFRAWVESPAFAHGHRGAGEAAPVPQGAEGDGDVEKGGARHAHAAEQAARGEPLATHSELWCYDVVDLSGGS